VIYSFSLAALSGGNTTATTTDTPDPAATAAAESAQTGDEALPQKNSGGTYTLGGRIVAYDKSTGAISWSIEQSNDYWASPVVVYDSQGKAYLIQCDRGGYVTMYDASNGNMAQTASTSEAGSIPHLPCSNNLLVVGTRGKGGSGKGPQIVCLKIS
jgi:outer membrane protein assembly factor BamB